MIADKIYVKDSSEITHAIIESTIISILSFSISIFGFLSYSIIGLSVAFSFLPIGIFFAVVTIDFLREEKEVIENSIDPLLSTIFLDKKAFKIFILMSLPLFIQCVVSTAIFIWIDALENPLIYLNMMILAIFYLMKKVRDEYLKEFEDKNK